MNAEHGYNEVLADTTTALREARAEIERLRADLGSAAADLKAAVRFARVYGDEDWATTFERGERRARQSLDA